MRELRTDHSEMAIFGLIYIVFGIVCIFLFISYQANLQIPSILAYKSNSFGLLVMGIVNLVNAWGVLSRKNQMWSITILFLIVQFAGCAMGVFFIDTTMRIAMCVLFAVCALYMFSTPAREWYQVK